MSGINLKQKINLILWGVLLGFIFLEIFLRVSGWGLLLRQEYRNRIGFKEKEVYRILCLGDSVTEGFGAPRNESYPRQLEKIINEEYHGGKIRVINWGEAGENSARLLDKVRKRIYKISPDTVILLSGEGNYFDYYGYCEYRKRENILKKGKYELYSKIVNYLYRLRLYKFVRLFYCNLKDKKQVEIKNDQYFRNGEKMIRMSSSPKERYDDMEMWRYIEDGRYEEVIEKLKKKIDNNSGDSRNYTMLGQVYFLQEEYNEAIKWLKKAVFINPDDVSNYNMIENAYGLFRVCNSEMIEWFKKAIEMNRQIISNYTGLGMVYFGMCDYEKALEYFTKALELKNKGNFKFIGLLYKRQGKYKEGIEFLRKFSQESREARDVIAMLENSGDIDNWIKSDIEEIIKICKGCGIKIILQTYPSQYGGRTLPIFQELAEKYQVCFLDQYKIFQDLLSKGETIDNLFAADKDHCNSNGYGVMARNLYNLMCWGSR